MPPTILTIGHSTRSAEEFTALLQEQAVTLVADVRTVPRSRRHPQFNQEALSATLAAGGVGYMHLPGLGGWRRGRPDSPHVGWQDAGFRAYADYMDTPEFAEQLEKLIALAGKDCVAVMCAEAVPGRCHRSMIADALSVRGVRVMHVLGAGLAEAHAVTPWARVEGTRLLYAAPDTLPFD
jgi:uncharacterized protein (DUF488 family)